MPYPNWPNSLVTLFIRASVHKTRDQISTALPDHQIHVLKLTPDELYWEVASPPQFIPCLKDEFECHENLSYLPPASDEDIRTFGEHQAVLRLLPLAIDRILGGGGDTLASYFRYFKDEDSVEDNIGSLLAALQTKDAWERWMEALDYFGMVKENTGTSIQLQNCKKLPGTNVALRPVQLYDIYDILVDSAEPSGPNGKLCAHDMGVGKPYIFQGLVAVRRLGELSYRHYQKYEGLHTHTRDGRCGLDDSRPFGVQCYCEENGLTRKIIDKFDAGATLLVVPAAVVNESAEKAKGYFKPTLRLPRPLSEPEENKERWTFITVVDFANDPNNSALRYAKAEMGFVNSQLPAGTPARKYQLSAVAAGTIGRKLLKEGGGGYSFAPMETDNNNLGSPYVIVSSSRIANNWDNQKQWTELYAVPVAGKTEQADFDVRGLYYFGTLVVDEAHEVKGIDTNFGRRIADMVERQVSAPLQLYNSGTPIRSSIRDLHLPMQGLGFQKDTGEDNPYITALVDLDADYRSFLKLSKDAARQGKSGPSSIGPSTHTKIHTAWKEFCDNCVQRLGGVIMRRHEDSNFFGNAIAPPVPATVKVTECPIRREVRTALDTFATTVKSRVKKQLDRVSAAPAVVKLGNSNDIAKLDMATHFPGLAVAWNDARADSDPRAVARLNWAAISKKLPSRAMEQNINRPMRLCKRGLMPDDLYAKLDTIISHSSRASALFDICRAARADSSPYPMSHEPWSEFVGPKNVLVFCKRPAVAHLVQMWFEKNVPVKEIESGFVHSKLNSDQRSEMVNWFRDFKDENGRPKSNTKVIITTYELLGMGLNGLTCANYVLHFGMSNRTPIEAQASRRVRRQGQPLLVHEEHLRSSDEIADKCVEAIRHDRAGLVGEEGKKQLAHSIVHEAEGGGREVRRQGYATLHRCLQESVDGTGQGTNWMDLTDWA
ncbi:hypothetical protein CMUS01_13067 [Colletotrichum musicola]|uniref:Helicase C-terminal domain-containing protein n=1 Tax=Colletotrichum musicola TaxID=2175873 RepID=A0A8H6MY03_9PEZI|nr:hypothetical protein CMUS01_13067 [Colletotrichum musicola]